MNSQPIGIFDSGVGGTSIWKEIRKLLPFENTIYLADSKNAPYGDKPADEILALSIKNTEYLLEQGSKIIVVACNTATTNAIAYLRNNYNVPFIGIEPAIKPAALNSTSKAIGVLATKGTLSSALFHSTAKNFSDGIKILEQNGEGLVPLIESGKACGKESEKLLLKYLKPMLVEGIDYLVLGCTHYPYLIPVLQRILPDNVKIIDSGEAVAKQTKAILTSFDLLADKQNVSDQFYTNATVGVLKQFVSDYNVAVNYLDF
ncbi:glutamate racemase [Cellulophaga baltica]|uniref:glutamate racemase n=1 Tax=Cellulophaga TaxID=104264 RepID=UPI001C073054|nr:MULTISPECIES: glutamate racemase [Cellulophaga]MBU2995150.1 glutamate racemase [Cellulophaga baltica]MDO6766545.1 glutamate racemase [Cellulophaga sp. 1_MG-2023]